MTIDRAVLARVTGGAANKEELAAARTGCGWKLVGETYGGGMVGLLAARLLGRTSMRAMELGTGLRTTAGAGAAASSSDCQTRWTELKRRF
jgi:hypothetical protein